MSTVTNNNRPVQPLFAVRAAAAPSQAPTPEFKTIEAYETFVRSSDVIKQLPGARARTASDAKVLANANAALEAKKREVNYSGLESAVRNAAAKLDEANHPMRAAAQKIEAEIPALSTESATLEDRIITLQSQISSAQSDQSSATWNNNPDNSLLSAVLTGVSVIADASSISSARKEITGLVQQKARLDAAIMTKTSTAATLANQPGAPEAIKPFQEALAAATQALAKADDTIKPEVEAVNAARNTLSRDTSAQNSLENTEHQLQDYDKNFSMGTRTQLWFKDKNWKQGLDAFWKQLGV